MIIQTPKLYIPFGISTYNNKSFIDISLINNSPEQMFFGIKDTYSEGGEYSFLKEKFNLIPNKISEKIMLKLKEL